MMVQSKSARMRSQISPSRNILLSVILLAISVLALYFYFFQVELPHESQISTNDIIIPTNSQTHRPENFRFIIKVLGYDRLESISRCLESLAGADYGGDRVKIHIFIDHFKISDDGNLNSKSVDDVDGKLRNAMGILEYVDGFEWKHGDKEIHYRTQNVGLQAQWLEAWWPSSDDEFAFVVEDDLVLSRLYYKYLKAAIFRYYYEAGNYDASVYGISLQRPRFVAGKHGNKLTVDNSTRLFLYQMVGTWGQLLFPKPWKEFRIWYDLHKSKGIEPIVDGMVTTGWYKRIKQKIWTPWFIKFIHSRGYFNIYTNFLHERALSISYRDAGVNYGKNVGPDSTLLTSPTSLDIDLWEMKPLKSLDWYDYCFSKVIRHRLVKRLEELEILLKSFNGQETITLVSLFGAKEEIVQNLLCQLQMLGIQSYILMGDKTSLLEDLARRGHAVVDTAQLSYDLTKVGVIGSPAIDQEEIMKVFVTAYILRSSLQLGYKTILMRENMLPLKNQALMFANAETNIAAMQIEEHLSTEILLVRNTKDTIELWSKILSNMASKPTSMGNQSSGEDILSFHLKSAMDESQMSSKPLTENFLKELGSSVSVRVNPSSFDSMTQVIHWISDKDANSVKKQLKSLNLWLVDEDLSCTAIVCHRL